MSSRRGRRPALLVFADSLAYYGPPAACLPMTPYLAQYCCFPTRLGFRADWPHRLDLSGCLVGGNPGSARLGGVTQGRSGDLRDRRNGFAAVGITDGAA